MAEKVDDVAARVSIHEAVCAERYNGINARLKRLEGWFVALIVAVLSGMGAIIMRLWT